MTSVAFRPGGRDVAMGLAIPAVLVVDPEDRKARVRTAATPAATVHCVAYSPDGRVLAAGDSTHGVRLWDASTLRSLRVLAGHEGDVLALAYSPVGRRIASGGYEGSVRIWDAEAGRDSTS